MVLFFVDIWEVIRDFLESGGLVLSVIFFATAFQWVLILERFWFLNKVFPKIAQETIEKWQAREDKFSWRGHKVRQCKISEAAIQANRNIPTIKTLVALCPLLGLLGTVSGMIVVFEVMANMGTSNARLMAGGISMATIPTMAGMVAALSGIYFGSRLESRSKLEIERLEDSLPYH